MKKTLVLTIATLPATAMVKTRVFFFFRTSIIHIIYYLGSDINTPHPPGVWVISAEAKPSCRRQALCAVRD